MKTQLNEWDGSKRLQTPEDIALYLAACIAENGSETAFISQALSDIARSPGLVLVAREAGINPKEFASSLLQNGQPNFEAMLTLTKALGLQFRIAPTAA